MNGRQQAYFGIRGGALVLFVVSATALPHGAPAVIGVSIAGACGLLTCIGVNAGGPGEQAAALQQGVRYEKVRAPQGDWPPFDASRIIDGDPPS